VKLSMKKFLESGITGQVPRRSSGLRVVTPQNRLRIIVYATRPPLRRTTGQAVD
jgi:hypothetical protein